MSREHGNRTDRGAAPGDDGGLSRLLHAWRAIEPPADFEAAVWGRILASACAPAPGRLAAAGTTPRRRFVPGAAWVNTLAAAAGLVLGIGLASSVSAHRTGRHADEPLLHARTLAGSYVTLATGAAR
jgi:hypothetical protein